jgi:hypothetical protein
MSNRNWDMDKRRHRVAEQGAERSEYTDVTELIAEAKSQKKARNTDWTKCPECDGYFPPGKKDEHRHVYYARPERMHKYDKAIKQGRARVIRQPLTIVIRDKFGNIIERKQLST